MTTFQTTPTRFSVTRSSPSRWRVTLDNRPINLVDPVMIVELHHLLTEIEQDEQVAVVVFDSAVPDYFIAHSMSPPTPNRLRRFPRRPLRFITGPTS